MQEITIQDPEKDKFVSPKVSSEYSTFSNFP